MSSDMGIYCPLSPKSIRLLELMSALPDEQIECSLTTIHDLDDAPDFEAISYVWGDNLSPNPIICNGVRITVTQNLEGALRHLRPLPRWESVQTWPRNHPLHSSRHVWGAFARNRYEEQENATSIQKPVWIDAICINQHDDVERAKQVKLMGNIYHRASTVKIWLGKEQPNSATTNTSAEAIQALTNPLQRNLAVGLGSAQFELNQSPVFARRHHLERYGDHMPIVLSFLGQALRNLDGRPNNLVALRPLHQSEHRNLMYGLPSPTAKEWAVFRHFLSNSWFQRTWIVQEVVLARRALLIFGDWQLDWDAVGEAITWYQDKGYAMPRTMRTAPSNAKDLLPVTDAASLWNMYSSTGKRTPLLTLMKDFRLRSTAQYADKLYAALGLAEETEGSDRRGFHALLEPDYSKSIQDVYRDLCIFLIIQHGSLLALSCVDVLPTQSPTWPSWVPDWRNAKLASQIWDSEEEPEFRASGEEPFSINLRDSNNSLCLEGISVDRVCYYGDKLESYGFGFETYLQERDFVRSAWSLAKSVLPRVQQEDIVAVQSHLRTFISTIIASRGEMDLERVWPSAAQWLSEHLNLHSPKKITLWSVGRKSVDTGLFHEVFVRACADRRFFVTRDGLMGIGPKAMKKEDGIVVLFGGKVPFVVRRKGSQYCLIGECYVTGIMKGETVERWRNSSARMREGFELS
ncbi:heterokaryon incompatibility protein-domain-containing protein [Xylariaceae sp. AK1471]|nr:heterokaryon incompatibility protein-domain-containing protein [Xylariaceae sp. AK1471]